jgi:FlaA1/EpsC-like NDP-sugar epimerase
MPTPKDKKIGLLILCVSAALFAFFFWYFKLDGKTINFNDAVDVLKTAITIAILPAGLYLALRFVSGKKLAMQVGGTMAVLMVLALFIGWVRFGRG